MELLNDTIERGDEEQRKEKRKQSFFKAIKKLISSLSDEEINSFIDEYLEVETASHLINFIPMHGLINLTKKFLIGNDANNYTIDQQVEKVKERLSNDNNYDLRDISSVPSTLKEKISSYLRDEYELTESVGHFTWYIYLLIRYIKQNLNNDEVLRSIIRNYGADKFLHNSLIKNVRNETYSIKDFCRKNSLYSFCIGSDAQDINFGTVYRAGYFERFCIERGNASSKTQENIFNMFRAGLIGTLIADPERAIGFNDLTLNKVACLTKEASILSNPQYEIQVLGRGGRSNDKGKYIFYRYTGCKSYIDHNKLIKLEGDDFHREFFASQEKYIKDEKNTIKFLSQFLVGPTLRSIEYINSDEKIKKNKKQNKQTKNT
ncbi:hypothetical protein, partial [Wolbachia endosymbiont of Pentidionis agamae]|uniref:hypothetical protein n=1 Tax=Wolbachia endosymbiont of Pentidionis agamae TaxID=3110435 RepID=UPI002FCFD375